MVLSSLTGYQKSESSPAIEKEPRIRFQSDRGPQAIVTHQIVRHDQDQVGWLGVCSGQSDAWYHCTNYFLCKCGEEAEFVLQCICNDVQCDQD